MAKNAKVAGFFFIAASIGTFVNYSWNTSNNDSLSVAQYVSDRNAVKNVVNGELKDGNFKAGANISQNKIDSTSGFITNAIGQIAYTSKFKELHSQYGLKVFANDSILYDKEMLFISDSTDSIMKIDNDSVVIYKSTSLLNWGSSTYPKINAGSVITDSIMGYGNMTTHQVGNGGGLDTLEFTSTSMTYASEGAVADTISLISGGKHGYMLSIAVHPDSASTLVFKLGNNISVRSPAIQIDPYAMFINVAGEWYKVE